MTDNQNTPEQGSGNNNQSASVNIKIPNNLVRTVFFFDSMITLKIITALYWILLVLVTVSGIGLMFVGSFISGLLTLILGGVGVRIWCELLMVLFKINANIQKLADRS
jgi:hypothetical protein